MGAGSRLVPFDGPPRGLFEVPIADELACAGVVPGHGAHDLRGVHPVQEMWRGRHLRGLPIVSECPRRLAPPRCDAAGAARAANAAITASAARLTLARV